MDSSEVSDLQKREEQYRALNAELEAKTARLLKEADSLLENAQAVTAFEQFEQCDSQNDDACCDQDYDYPNRQSSLLFVADQSCLENDGGILESDRIDKEKDEATEATAVGDVLPDPANKLSLKAQNRYLKAKVRVLQEELQKMNTELNECRDESLRYKKRAQELEEERNRLHRVTSSHSAQVEKVKKSLDETRTHCDTLEAERNALKKDSENLKRSASQQAAELKSASTRLHRASEETERLKTELEKVRSSNREVTESLKQTIDQLTTDNRRLERQKAELISGFKKQLRLIDVLRRQKMLIEASKCLQLTEEDFLKSLDWQTQ